MNSLWGLDLESPHAGNALDHNQLGLRQTEYVPRQHLSGLPKDVVSTKVRLLLSDLNTQMQHLMQKQRCPDIHDVVEDIATSLNLHECT